MDVRDAMTEVVLTIGPTHSLRDAATRMVARGVGAAIVADADSAGPGILTERDVLRALAAGADPDTAQAGDFRTPDAMVAHPGWSLDEAARTMLRGGFRHLIVVEDGRTIGVISVRDVLRAHVTSDATG